MAAYECLCFAYSAREHARGSSSNRAAVVFRGPIFNCQSWRWTFSESALAASRYLPSSTMGLQMACSHAHTGTLWCALLCPSFYSSSHLHLLSH